MSARAARGRPKPFQIADGRWQLQVEFPAHPDGRRDRRRATGATRAQCVAAARKLERDRDSGIRVAARPPTVAQWTEQWLRSKARTCKATTTARYTGDVVNHIRPHLGAFRLDRLTSADIEAMYDWTANELGLSTASVQHLHRVVRMSLRAAVAAQKIAISPAENARPPTSGRRVRIHPYTVGEARAILTAAEHTPFPVRWHVALVLGLRQGECLGLRLIDVDLEQQVLRVEQQSQRGTWQHGCRDPQACGGKYHRFGPCPIGPRTGRCQLHYQRKRGCPEPCPADCVKHAANCPRRHGGGMIITDTKSGAGERFVGIPDSMIPLLRDHLQGRAAMMNHAEDMWQESGLLFTRPVGTAIDPLPRLPGLGQALRGRRCPAGEAAHAQTHRRDAD